MTQKGISGLKEGSKRGCILEMDAQNGQATVEFGGYRCFLELGALCSVDEIHQPNVRARVSCRSKRSNAFFNVLSADAGGLDNDPEPASFLTQCLRESLGHQPSQQFPLHHV